MLCAVNLHAGYRRGVPVLHGIDLEVGAGGALGVIGRNGAGKTCLAQTLTGALPVMDGTVLLGGDDVSGKGSRARVRARLSHVPEGRMIFADLTVRENLEVAAYGAGVKLTAQQLRDVEQRFPILERKAHDRAGSLSGGEQQWLAIGRALVQQPRVIVLDEPSLGLSPVAIDGVAEALVGIREAGVALILMEQNPYLLKAVCDEVLLLDQGRVTRSLDGEAGEQLVAEAYFGG
ncbi:ATP-binding cassette domain-containing protein [Conexibacter sp. JD483]|uniref:ABC transporter ATP-binding protein n=1 Tax=unclassified Conexibacter TaxID=2627773 RepID=UPI00271FAB5B|nr:MULTISPECIES: ATP-binding cassette domain-containing protein [unclassified Conexibacter]MDO8187740.1 ATP-binding cassette domain-containing protein [Conexibacter sp. CPCC 205706]MDO8200243.1 ATP-binding cassette domain-containing protein [Conexibacter sp. CPCC 205762]MDR9369419.1 ATP-binding cassette domain-containing protein [Conexibacter sp. JD483]